MLYHMIHAKEGVVHAPSSPGAPRAASSSDMRASPVPAAAADRVHAHTTQAEYKAQTQRETYSFTLWGSTIDTTKYHKTCLWDNSWYDWSIFIGCFIALYGITSFLFTIGFKAMERCEFAHSMELGPSTSSLALVFIVGSLFLCGSHACVLLQ